MRPLYPPVEMIRANLFDGPPRFVDDEAASERHHIVESPAAMPAFLADMIRRKVASQQSFPPSAPAVGQIRVLTEASFAGDRPPLAQTVSVLLGAHLRDRTWSGWIVAREVDYATERDLVLEEEDGPLSPESGMVQTWNPVRVIVGGGERILGKLRPARLGAVIGLAGYVADAGEFVAPRPGRVGLWALDGETSVVTGTPLGGDEDPRREYQQLYRDLANELRAATEVRVDPVIHKEDASLWARLGAFLARPVWAYSALVLVLVQGVWIASGFLAPTEEWSGYRSQALSPAARGDCSPRIHVVFRPETQHAEVVILLRKVEARTVDGPSETGEFWLAVPKGRIPEEALAMLKASDLVEEADLIPANQAACAR